MIPADSPWRNAITPDFVTTIAFNRRLSRAHRITCPLWVGLGERDITVHSRSVEGLARRAPHGVLQRYPYDHCEPFQGQASELIIKDQLDFRAQADLIPLCG